MLTDNKTVENLSEHYINNSVELEEEVLTYDPSIDEFDICGESDSSSIGVSSSISRTE